MTLTGAIEFTGETLSDVEFAVEEALKRIMEGNTSGFDRNETGGFVFAVVDTADPARSYPQTWEHPDRPLDMVPAMAPDEAADLERRGYKRVQYATGQPPFDLT